MTIPRAMLDERHTLSGDELDAWFDTHHTSDLLRIENRPEYLVDSDGGDYERFQQGRTLTSAEHAQWLGYLDSERTAGRTWRRARLFHGHPGDYGLYECHAFVDSAAHGEQIRVLEADAAELPDVPDFFVLDGRHVLRSVYDEVGHHLGGVIVTGSDAAVYRTLAAALWVDGEDFSTWWAAHQQYHRTLRAA